MDREATRAAIGRLRARTLTYGEVEDALWDLAEREGLHDHQPDDPEPEPCSCSLCQLIIPLLSDMARAPPGGAPGGREDRARGEKGPRR